ncbi:MAG: hypothetical protein SFW36_07550 [Leptolyngbyaceae cyanobacterium bins.59]|nr:hypothetical protein [Leptolyngbyaceae cyanobacterium bins.59]
MQKLQILKIELKSLQQEVARLYAEGRVLMDCWIAHSKPDGNKANKYPRLKSRKPIFNGKKTEYLSIQGTAIEEAQAALERGRTIKKLQKRIQELTDRIAKLQAKALSPEKEAGKKLAVDLYTPPSLLHQVREMLGEIDLDPASDSAAQERVQAAHYYTAAHNGLNHPWWGRVWLHSPTHDKTEPWIQKLLLEYSAGRITEALVLVKPAIHSKWFQQLLAQYPVCFPKKSIALTDRQGTTQLFQGKSRVIFYLGSRSDRFYEVFGKVGSISVPATPPAHL